MSEAPIAGVYAINHGEIVYVGESKDVLNRATYVFAGRLNLPRGIVVEVPGSSKKARSREEKRVTELFERRGFTVVNDLDSRRLARQWDVPGWRERHRERMVAQNKARKWTKESRQKHSVAHKGLHFSPEHRVKLSVAATRQWARWREERKAS